MHARLGLWPDNRCTDPSGKLQGLLSQCIRVPKGFRGLMLFFCCGSHIIWVKVMQATSKAKRPAQRKRKPAAATRKVSVKKENYSSSDDAEIPEEDQSERLLRALETPLAPPSQPKAEVPVPTPAPAPAPKPKPLQPLFTTISTKDYKAPSTMERAKADWNKLVGGDKDLQEELESSRKSADR